MRTVSRVLVLAGTTEASTLAERLAAAGVDVTSSLAGVTTHPRPRPGRVRVGGFGGAVGLAEFLRVERVDALIDATHPFAAQMPFNAATAAGAAGVPRCRVLRPAWVAGADDRWMPVPTLDAAREAVRRLGARRVLLTVGRQSARAFADGVDVTLVVRAIEPPTDLPPSAHVVLDRGPFDLDAERRLLAEHRIDALVTKNSGGDATSAKLVAARLAGIPVVMVERPPQPAGPVARTVDEALSWLRSCVPTIR
jgi:precorrin-6A/cobalt-precorrin-6A reductase